MFTDSNEIKNLMKNSSIITYKSVMEYDSLEKLDDEDEMFAKANIIRRLSSNKCDNLTDEDTIKYYLSDTDNIQKTIQDDLVKRLRDNRDMLVNKFNSKNTVKSVVNNEELFQSIFEFFVEDYNEHGIFSMDFTIDDEFNLFDTNNRDIIFKKIDLNEIRMSNGGNSHSFTKTQFTTGISGSLLFKNASSLLNGFDEYFFEHTGIDPDDGESIYEIKIIKYDGLVRILNEVFENNKSIYRPDTEEDETSLVEYNELSSKQNLKIFGPSIDDIITSIILDLEGTV